MEEKRKLNPVLTRSMLNDSVQLINAIQNNNLDQTKLLCKKFAEDYNFNGQGIESAIFMYIKNVLFSKNYQLLNNSFYYLIENLNFIHKFNIHLYFSIWYKLATLPEEANVNKKYTLINLVNELENNEEMLESLTAYDFEYLITTCICRNELDLMNRINNLMGLQKKDIKNEEMRDQFL